MKKAIFISNPNENKTRYKHPWHEREYFNNKGIDLPKLDGLMLFMTRFDAANAEKVLLRATSLGIFEAFVNGKRVGNDELKPGWTDYRIRVFEFEYDITELCKNDNIFVAQVSNGWWSGRISFGFYGFKKNAFCGEIEVIYKDGSSKIFASGEDWKTSIGGKIRTADMWDGIYYDANQPDPCLEPEKYEWVKPEIVADAPKIVALNGNRILHREYLDLKPISSKVWQGTVDNGSELGEVRVLSQKIGNACDKISLKKGEAVIFDFGQDMVGVPEFEIKAPAGSIVRGYFAEFLNDSGESSRGNDGAKGSMYIKNYRTALARIVYEASGDGIEKFAPTHVFFGFRYFELCAENDIEILSIKGNVIGSDIKEIGDIVTSDPLVNKLISNIKWGMRGNYLSIPTDCPQRDERLGWTGDTQIFSGAGAYLGDTYSFMKKWMTDMRDSQVGFNGGYCDVAPRVFPEHSGNAAWGDAGLVVPYKMWLMFGDDSIIEENFESMEDYMKYLSSFGLEGPNIAYGDWLNYDVTDKRYIAVCYYAYDAYLMSFFAKLLARKDKKYLEKVSYYDELRKKIVAYYLEKYTDGDGPVVKTQTGCLLPLAFDLVDGELREKTIALLRKKIESNNYTLSTGFVGTGILNQTLSKLGMGDLAYSLLLQTADPSWLYSVKQGATTVWERWNSYTLERGFGDVNMNSFNHYAYGAVLEWMFSDMAGIKPCEETPGFENFILCPTPDTRSFIPDGQKRITCVKAHRYISHGRIESAWEYEEGKLVCRFKVPDGCKALVKYPEKSEKFIINGAEFSLDALGGKIEGERSVFELTGGQYTVIAL